jgi:hypothetical protein
MPQRSRSTGSTSQNTDRDERGRFTEESSTRGGTSGGMSSGSRSQDRSDRDEQGRFTEGSSSRSSGGHAGNRNTTTRKK